MSDARRKVDAMPEGEFVALARAVIARARDDYREADSACYGHVRACAGCGYGRTGTAQRCDVYMALYARWSALGAIQ